jgi:ubiquinone/menaquinone biosynthesis C-methylase UbiE
MSVDPSTSSRTHAPSPTDFVVEFPEGRERLEQDHEWCTLSRDGDRERLRFHDYGRIYEVPGLYEHLFYTRLECESPQMVRSLLEGQLRRSGADPSDLSVIDVGAGNGMVGEELADMGAGKLIGVDLLAEAAAAAERDRPHVYEDYFVVDLTDLSDADLRALEAHDFNCLTTVAALGFGDIPPQAFAQAYNLVEDGGWVAFNIKEDFLEGDDSSGFSRLIESLVETGRLEIGAKERYRHRYAVNGDELMYVAMVGVKHDGASRRLVEKAEQISA